MINFLGKKMLYRHKKTGTLYRILIEATNESDLTALIVYISLVNGKIWARPAAEFFDGRFETVNGPIPL